MRITYNTNASVGAQAANMDIQNPDIQKPDIELPLPMR